MKDESILVSVKRYLGIIDDCTSFDDDLMLHINSIFSVLTQAGIGPAEGFNITDSSTQWSEFLGEDMRLSAVKSYMNLRVKLLFDPPTSSTLMQAIKEQIKELEWRMYIVKDNDNK